MEDSQDSRRRVQQYVRRQRAYLPVYTAVDECHVTPSKLPRSDAEFGFDTPVLRPRAPANERVMVQRAGPHGVGPANQRSRATPSDTREITPGKKDGLKRRRRKASTPDDADDGHVARLADRRERQRRKRTIVSPPQKDDETPTVASKKERTKKSAALALLYGFSATNVTRGRLTLKPAPSLGVFSKGKASVKKKVTATKRSSSRHELFSEAAFLNKPGERTASPSKIADTDNSISDPPVPHETRATKHTNQDLGKCTETSALRTSRTTSGAAAGGSGVWDIEVQSKLPSSACSVSSGPGAKESALVVLNPRANEIEWCSPANGEHDEHRNVTRAANSPVSCGRSGGRSMVGTGLELRDEHCHSDAADVSSLHPSHSASQAGRRGADTQPSDQRLVTSKYFTEPDLKSPTSPTQAPVSDGGIRSLDSQDEDAVMDGRRTRQAASPISSLISVPLRVAEFQTRYDMDPHEFRSDDRWADVDMPLESLEALDYGYSGSPVAEPRDDRFDSTPGDTWERYLLAGPAANGVELEASYDPLIWGCEDDLEDAGPVVDERFFEEEGVYDAEEGYYVAPTRQEFSVYEGEGAEMSTDYGDESTSEVADFLEGRALLFGVYDDRARRGGLPGLVEAEKDVANRLRDHWRPLRL